MMVKSINAKLRWMYMAAIYGISLLYVMFQGGKTAFMLFIILNLLLLYLLLGHFSGIYRVHGKRTVKVEGDEVREPYIRAGTQLELELHITIPGYYPLTYVIVRDYLKRHDGQLLMFEDSFLPTWRKGGRIAYKSPQLKRGGYTFQKTECLTYDVFGLFEHKGSFESGTEIAVQPQTVYLRSWDSLFKSQQGLYAHAAASRSAKETTQLNGIREYLPGDRLSRVHWNATAKTGEWKSKAFEKESLPRMIVILDCSKESYSSSGDDFELAVSAAASLLESGLRSNTAMGLLTTGHETAWFNPRADAWQKAAVLKHLTFAEPSGLQTLLEAVKHSEALLDKGGVVIVVSASPLVKLLPVLDWLQRRELHPHLIRTGAAEPGIEFRREQSIKWPIYSIHELHELPAVLEGGGRR
ncbi:DUF58 domain-containing protein [Paenibacillus sp. IITD108]|uniref:DUF58 domain-containing protein n=1 Tax=Paenibacillus sp. IITD108 TaxID=3116649 RepID=UPI002F41BD61